MKKPHLKPPQAPPKEGMFQWELVGRGSSLIQNSKFIIQNYD
ncbi:hypothetical protein HMPREF0973_00118 [Prevotella veroralis F0319]|uniref:Uncharacterized protein n=1 Tax=Prevotella veroralis F0319 TaxID=649761 RepID=C9MKL0_9BACT|nr:hypothetical protein HMPREF0973_00118 [Prevotella veroralis F0319]